MPNSQIDSSLRSSSHLNNCRVTENTDTTRLNCVQALEHESAPSGGPFLVSICLVDIDYNHQPSSGLHSGLELLQCAAENIDARCSDPYGPLFSLNSFYDILSAIPCIDLPPTQLDKGKSDHDAELAHDPWRNFDSVSWKDILDGCTESIKDQSLFSPSHPDIKGKFPLLKAWNLASVEDSSSLSKQPMDQKLPSDSACDTTSKFHKEEVNHLELMNSIDPQLKQPDIRNDNLMENCFQTLLSNEEHNYALPPNPDGWFNLEGQSIHSSDREHLFDGILAEQGSKKRSSSGDNGETGSSATNPVTSSLEDAPQLSSKISSLLKGNNKELDQMKTGSGTKFSLVKLKDQLLQKHLKEKLREWILQKDAEASDDPSILDEDGQGFLHLAAALAMIGLWSLL
ncbi:hypothetical protein SLEP1_g46820 [Rubroshorea leprosula]|uniref:Uncharacterized protein n=1 Tax=Rubroshorea leprosula TaxID=152421 RepID=A0AAV5LNG8_9ROSI|nr:hypothetical protein SLEP1_g46820 [Rubroshorea leprosula]